MHRNADRARLIGNRAGDGLANPPRRVGREFETLGIIELFNRFNQAQISLLNQIEKEHTAADVALGDGNHQAQIRFGQLLFRCLGHFAAHLHLLGNFNFLFCRQKRNLADLLEVHANRIVDADAFRDREIHIRSGYVSRQNGSFILRRIDDVNAFGFQCLKNRVDRVCVNIQIAELIHHILISQRLFFVARKVEDFLHLLLCLFPVQCH